MKSILIATLVVAVVSGCKDQGDVDRLGQIVCIDGVKYHTYFSGNRAAMAVAIDRETLQPIKCYGGGK